MNGLNKWFSCKKKNIKTCCKVQKYLDSYPVNMQMIKYLLYYGLKKDDPFIELYLKKNKDKDDTKLDFLKILINDMYCVNKKDFNIYYWNFIKIKLKDENFVAYIVAFFGLSHDEAKILGFKIKKLNKDDVFENEVDLFG